MTRSVGPSRDVNHVCRTLASLPSSAAMGPADLATIDSIRSTAIGLVKKWDDARAEQSRRALVRSQRDVTPIVKAGPKPAAKKKPLPLASPKRLAEKEQRDAVIAFVIARDKHCQGPAAGLPGSCGIVRSDRKLLEVHETHQRSTHPGSHLDPEMCRALCQRHHDDVTSASGTARELAEASGLLVRNSTPVTPHVRDEPVRAGSQDRETPE